MNSDGKTWYLYPGRGLLELGYKYHVFPSLFILHNLHPALEDGTDRGFRNVGKLQSDAGEIPKRIHTIVYFTIKFKHQQLALGHYKISALITFWHNLKMLLISCTNQIPSSGNDTQFIQPLKGEANTNCPSTQHENVRNAKISPIFNLNALW